LRKGGYFRDAVAAQAGTTILNAWPKEKLPALRPAVLLSRRSL